MLSSGTAFLSNISNQFKFKNGWSAELNGWYRSKEIKGQIISNPIWSISTGVQKEILKKKGTLKLGIRDIFNSHRFGKPLKTQQTKNNGGAGDEQNRIKKG